MTLKSAPAGRFSLRRWSQRKLEAARAEVQAAAPLAAAASVESPMAAAASTLQPVLPGPPADAPLPPIESLSIDSDYTPFFRPQVDESIKRAALKQLFRDPRFNVMDGLDTYIDDYTQPDPIPSAMLEGLMQRHISVAVKEAQTDSEARIDDVPAVERAPSAAPAVAPPVASFVAPIAVPITAAKAPADNGRNGAGPALPTAIDAKSGKP